MLCYVDGGYRNDGTINETGYGSYKVIGSGVNYITHFKLLEAKTNNEAEYLSLLNLLQFLVGLTTEQITIFSDSKVLVNQMNGLWVIHAKNLQRLHEQCQAQLQHLTNVKIVWTPRKNIVKELGH